MKTGDRVKFTAESILWLYYKDLWPDSVGVVERELPVTKAAAACIDVRFAELALAHNAFVRFAAILNPVLLLVVFVRHHFHDAVNTRRPGSSDRIGSEPHLLTGFALAGHDSPSHYLSALSQ